MTNSDEALREFILSLIERIWQKGNADSHECNTRFDDLRNLQKCVDNNLDDAVKKLTALISEHYYPKEKYDELLQQRDELREALKRIADPIGYIQNNLKEGERLDGIMALRISESAQYLKDIAEAAIKNTETK